MKLIELLQLNREKLLPAVDRVQRQIQKRRILKIATLWSGIVLLFCCLLIFSVQFLIQGQEGPQNIVLSDAVNVIKSIEPNRSSATGMQVHSDLLITTTQNVPPADFAGTFCAG